MALTVALVALGACRARPAPLADEGSRALPTYDEVYAQAEARIGALDRFWAIAVVGLRYVDADGERRRQQGEGHLQVVRPSRVALTIGKLGETYLMLGCDEDRFWWIERLEERRAYVGQQGGARDLALQRVGVPVLPTDLLLLGDLAAWPAPGSDGAGRVVACEREGLDPARVVAVEFEEGGRTRRVYVSYPVFDPVGVDLVGSDGTLVARSELSYMEAVLNRVDPLRPARVPTRVHIDVPSAESRIELSLRDMEISERRPRGVAFDFEELVRRLGVDEVIRLEELRPVADGAGR